MQGMSQLTFERNGLVMTCGVIKRRDGHVVLTGRVNGEERLRCDMSTTYHKHPDRFAAEVKDVALHRLAQIEREGF